MLFFSFLFLFCFVLFCFVLFFHIGGWRNAFENFISNLWFSRGQRKTLRVSIPLLFFSFLSLLLPLSHFFHSFLLRLCWLFLFAWRLLFGPFKVIVVSVVGTRFCRCLNFCAHLTLRLTQCIAAISRTSAKPESRFTEMVWSLWRTITSYNNISPSAAALLTTGFGLGCRRRKPHTRQYVVYKIFLFSSVLLLEADMWFSGSSFRRLGIFVLRWCIIHAAENHLKKPFQI